MSNSGRRKPPLVTDKRYAKQAQKKAAPKRKTTPSRKRPKKRGVLAWVLAPF